MSMVIIEKFTQYLQLFKENIVHDNAKEFILEYGDLEEIDKKLPDLLIDKGFLKYTITYYSTPFQSLFEFKSEIENVYKGNLDANEGKVRIVITKEKLVSYFNENISNAFIFFSCENYIANGLLTSIGNNEYKNVLFLIGDFDANLYENPYLIVTGLNNIVNQESKLIETTDKDLFKILSIVYDTKDINNYYQIPHYWHFTEVNSLLIPFYKKCVESFFYLISNKIKFPDNIYLIKGHHNLEIKLTFEDIKLNTTTFINIINFTLDEKRHYDKLLIIRNVLTTYLNNFSTITQLNQQIDEVFSTAQHHFELYVQNEIKIFIEQKNQVLNETISVTKQVSQLTADIGNNLRNLLLTLFAAIVISVIPQIVDNNSNRIVIIFLISSYLAYLGFSFYISYKIKNQLDNYLEIFKNYTIYVSSQSLRGLDYQSLKNKFILKEEKNFLNLLRVYRVTIFVLIVFSLTMLLFLI